MKKLITMIAILPVLLALLLAGCTIDTPEHPTGLTDVNNGVQYMSLGNSLTAGYMDSGLIMSGQMGSYPLLIAQQMGLDTTIGTGEFNQPLVASPGIGSSDPETAGNVAGVLHFDGTSISLLGETPLNSVQSLLMLATVPTPYENMGVPGAWLNDVMGAYSSTTAWPVTFFSGLPGYDPADYVNPFFDFINRASFFGVPGSTDPMVQPTMMVEAIAKGARIATLWIGNNDVLGGATAGNPIVGVTVTDPSAFTTQYTTTLLTLAGGLVQRNGVPSYIVVANIPSITDVPYFIPRTTFEAVFEANAGVPWSMTAGYLEDDVELVTLPALSDAADYVATGLPGNYTLTTTEVGIVDNVVGAYNSAIANAVNLVNASYPGTCALYDVNATMANDVTATQKTHFLLLLGQTGDVATAASMTYFSLDGVHPNQMGYGLVANGFLETINELVGTDYPMVDVSSLSWDPTYGTSVGTAVEGIPSITPEAGAALRNMFR